MLTQKLTKTIEVLDRLIELTTKDIQNIKLAKHEEVFANIKTKEELAYEFSKLKSEVDQILVARNKPIEEIFSPQEEELFNIFREKLLQFHKLHKHFSKLSLSVANFYNALLSQIKQSDPINYKNESFIASKLQLKA